MQVINRVKEIIYNKDYVTSNQDRILEHAELEQVIGAHCNNKTIALIETFEFHGECIPSYIKYLIDYQSIKDELKATLKIFEFPQQATHPLKTRDFI